MEYKILVTVICTTFNHEHYIAEAIDSFLMQKTDFKYEILIHDDASTDRTAEIISEYEKKYPELIKPIYQVENQYSKGVSVSMLATERAKGKYIAFCEGDDYWTDPYKLQKQADYMEKHPECSLCVHGGYRVNDSINKVTKHRSSNKNKEFTVEEIIEGGGDFFLTNSMFYPKKLAFIRPDFFNHSQIEDYLYSINLSLLGKVFYFDELMSVYRSNVSGSWTARTMNTIEKRIKHNLTMEKILNEINDYTKGQYKESIERTIKYQKVLILLAQRKYNEAKSSEYSEFYRGLSLKKKFSIFLNNNAPKFYNFIRNKRGQSKWAMRLPKTK